MSKLKAQVEQFNENGYLVIPGILTAERIEELHRLCKKIYFETGEQEVFSSRFLSEPLLYKIPFEKTVISILEALVGANYIVYPNFTVRNNVYVPWHVDNGFMRFSREVKESLFIQCVIYLQDNSEVFGGGLDVVPKSQFYAYSTDVLELMQRVKDGTRLDSKAGDLVMWDARLLHRSTQPQLASVSNKFGIHWTVSKSDAPAQTYLQHLVNRSTREFEGQKYVVPRFNDIKQVNFPDSFQAEVVEAVALNQLTVASIPSTSGLLT